MMDKVCDIKKKVKIIIILPKKNPKKTKKPYTHQEVKWAQHRSRRLYYDSEHNFQSKKASKYSPCEYLIDYTKMNFKANVD